MRPVEKGSSPYETINKYEEAKPYLVAKIGAYCSYCELPLKHVAHVEHVEAKSEGGSKTSWDNLLLSCVHCNSRKGVKIKGNESNRCIWPDKDNTLLAFLYENGYVTIAEEYLRSLGEEPFQKARELFKVTGLGNMPAPKEGDIRWFYRLEAYGSAIEAHEDWVAVKDSNDKERFMKSINREALATGFFSIWMTVFKDEVEIKRMLVSNFPGVSSGCFDENFNPINRVGGTI